VDELKQLGKVCLTYSNAAITSGIAGFGLVLYLGAIVSVFDINNSVGAMMLFFVLFGCLVVFLSMMYGYKWKSDDKFDEYVSGAREYILARRKGNEIDNKNI